MSSLRVHSSPNLFPTSSEQRDDSSLEGVSATVKLLMKLIEDHKEACSKERNDSRRMLRVAGMMTVLENVRARIQKSQSFGKRREAELRRCSTDLVRDSAIARDNRPPEPADEKEKLRRDLSSCLMTRRSLEVMCTSLGKEKEIMAAELARKVQELSGMEELVNDLKAQNETLLEKAQEYKQRKQGDGSEGGDVQANLAALQDRNKLLSEQLLRSLEGYKYMKRKLKEAQAEKAAMSSNLEGIGIEVGAGLEKIRGLKQRIKDIGSEQSEDFEEGILELEKMLESLEIKVLEHGGNK